MTTPTTENDNPSGPEAEPRRLTRSRTDHVIAGVCGGLGRYANVDPVVFRVALAVLAFFGGVGVLLYLIGWLFLPEDGDTSSPAESILGRGHSSTNAALTVLLLVLAAIALMIALDGDHVFILALVVLGGILLVRHTSDQPRPPQPPAAPPEGGGPPTSPTGPTAATQQPYAPHGPYATSSYATSPYAGAPPSGPDATTAQFSPPPPPPPRPPRERPVLGRIVVSLGLLLLAGLMVANRLGADIPAAAVVAAALGVVGLGLVLGAFFGRARGLPIALGVILTLVLFGLTTAHHVDRSFSAEARDVTWAPATVTQLQPSYHLDAGSALLDLRGIDFTGASESTRVSVGAGNTEIRLPDNVDVTVHGHVGAGQLDLFDLGTGGLSADRTVTDHGVDGPGGGQLELYIDNGIGSIEVKR